MLVILLLLVIIVQLSIIIHKLPERDYVAEAMERDRKAREDKINKTD